MLSFMFLKQLNIAAPLPSYKLVENVILESFLSSILYLRRGSLLFDWYESDMSIPSSCFNYLFFAIHVGT